MIKRLNKKLYIFLAITLLLPSYSSAGVLDSTLNILPYGSGRDGDLTITSSRNELSFTANASVTVATNASYASTTVNSTTGFSAGDYVLIHQSEGDGDYEIKKIGEIASNDLVYTTALTYDYGASGAQVVKINEYHDVNVNSGGTWTTTDWNASTNRGGILVAMLTGTLTVNTGGSINVDGSGYKGGSASTGQANQGSSKSGDGGASQSANAGGGGGGFNSASPNSCGGGGAGHSGGGGNGSSAAFCNGGASGGNAEADSLSLATSTYFGAGGGGGSSVSGSNGGGGNGGGFILIISAEDIITTDGDIDSAGSDGDDAANGDGGGGAGGSIRLLAKHNLTLGTNKVTALGGSGNDNGGGGGAGRIATAQEATVTGTASPTINTLSTTTVYNLDQDSIIIGLGAF